MNLTNASSYLSKLDNSSFQFNRMSIFSSTPTRLLDSSRFDIFYQLSLIQQSSYTCSILVTIQSFFLYTSYEYYDLFIYQGLQQVYSTTNSFSFQTIISESYLSILRGNCPITVQYLVLTITATLCQLITSNLSL